MYQNPLDNAYLLLKLLNALIEPDQNFSDRKNKEELYDRFSFHLIKVPIQVV